LRARLFLYLRCQLHWPLAISGCLPGIPILALAICLQVLSLFFFTVSFHRSFPVATKLQNFDMPPQRTQIDSVFDSVTLAQARTILASYGCPASPFHSWRRLSQYLQAHPITDLGQAALQDFRMRQQQGQQQHLASSNGEPFLPQNMQPASLQESTTLVMSFAFALAMQP